MAGVAPRVAPPDGRLLAGWVLAGAASTILATLLAGAIGAAGWDPGWSGWLLLSTNLILYVVQWAILRAYLPGLHWPSWVGPSTLALIGSSLLLATLELTLQGRFAGNPYPPLILDGLLGGASIGFAQSLVLGRYVRRSDWWIPAYALGQAAQNVTAQALSGVGGSTDAFLATLFEAGPIGAVLGLVTGVTLGALLRDPVPPQALAALLARQAARPRGVRLRAYLGTGLLVLISLTGLLLALAFLNPPTVAPPAESVPPPPTLRPADIPSGWRLFTSDAGRFRVAFPTSPIESTTNTESADAPVPQHVLVAAGAQSQYAVLYADNPTDIPSSEVGRDLDALRNGMLQSSHGELQDEQPIAIGGYQGRELRLQMGDGRAARIWAVFTRRRVYQVVVFHPGSLPEPDDALKFLRSFQLLGP